LTGTVYIN